MHPPSDVSPLTPGSAAPPAPSSPPATPATAPPYDPGRLLDALRLRLALRTDSALARALGLSSPILSKIRHRLIPMSGAVLLIIHQESGIDLAELRRLMGDRRQRFRTSGYAWEPRTRALLTAASPERSA